MLNIGEFARLGRVTPRMLRHYDQIGMLKPERVDLANGYRLYGAHQLSRLHRILALRDLGFTLEQIREVLEENPPVEQLRGMLRMRRAQIEQIVGEERERLRRVEAHLRTLEGSHHVDVQDIVIKQTQPIRMAQATAEGLAHPDIGPAFGRLLPEVLAHLDSASARPGISAAYYEDQGGSAEEGSIVLHAGFEIGDQEVPDSGRVQVVSLPVVEVASVVHRGSMDGIAASWEALVGWIEDSGYRLTGDCRELYHEWHEEEPSRHITELQQPIVR
jgi:DNA-binding transcriptional MerR regulator/predicted transcriptional regulator YdeE